MYLQESYKSFLDVSKLNRKLNISSEKYKISLGKAIVLLPEHDLKHSYNVSILIYRFAKLLRLDYFDIFRFGFYHDIGKVNLEKYVSLPRKLKEEEFEEVKKHTLIGTNILLYNGKNKEAEIALLHHESYDGSGYLIGLEGKEIPLESRIMKIVDVYEALRGKRPYKESFSIEKSLEIMLQGDKRTKPEHFDKNLLYIFADFINYIDLTTSDEDFEKYVEKLDKKVFDIK